MANFGPLMAEIGLRVWGTPANFNKFRILAALLHGTPAVGVSQTAALNRGHHLYSAGRPSRWALAHILVYNTSHAHANLGFVYALCWMNTHDVQLQHYIIAITAIYYGRRM